MMQCVNLDAAHHLSKFLPTPPTDARAKQAKQSLLDAAKGTRLGCHTQIRTHACGCMHIHTNPDELCSSDSILQLTHAAGVGLPMSTVRLCDTTEAAQVETFLPKSAVSVPLRGTGGGHEPAHTRGK